PPKPVPVVAHQEPVQGRGRLSAAGGQRDRFLMKINVGYPTPAEEREIVYRMGVEPPVAQPVVSTEDLLALQQRAGRVFVHHAVVDYVVRLVIATREPA